jgi:quercetin dioxygenase-like cupin family protein
MQIIRLKEREARELIPGGQVKFAHSDHMTVAFWSFEAGSILPEHAHPHEQIINLLEGSMMLTVGGKTEKVESDMAIVIPSGVSHSGTAVTACKIIDVFYPVREDFASLDT